MVHIFFIINIMPKVQLENNKENKLDSVKKYLRRFV